MRLTFELLRGLNRDYKDAMEFVINKHTAVDLKKLLKENGIKGYSKLNKVQLVQLVIDSVNTIATTVKKAVKQLLLPAPISTTKNEKGFYFEERDCVNVKDLKYAYKQLCSILHPDKGGNISMFNDMQNEYNIRLKYVGLCGRDISSIVFLDAFDNTHDSSISLEFKERIVHDMMDIGDKYHYIITEDIKKQLMEDVYVNGKLVYKRTI